MPAKGRRITRPSTTLEGREGQLVNLAMDLAQKQMEDGTASAQVITHYLKLGTVREQMERDRLLREIDVLSAKVEGMGSMQRSGALLEEAMKYFTKYRGEEEEDEDYGEQNLY